jgi:hypothetical protein
MRKDVVRNDPLGAKSAPSRFIEVHGDGSGRKLGESTDTALSSGPPEGKPAQS